MPVQLLFCTRCFLKTQISNGYDAAEVQRQEDDLDRWRFASEIVEVVLTTPAGWSARIGVFGKWGEGKSTVLHFAESLLLEKGSIVFTFSPWAIQGWDELWEDFGNRLSEALDAAGIPFDDSWTKRLKASSKWLESSGVGQVVENAVGLWGKDRLFHAAFGAVSRWLRYDGEQIRAIRKKLGEQRLVVLIDDLDRCPPTLIPQLLLSLRELLDLPGFTFILAFDDEIVAEALTQSNPAWIEGSNFLDKILDFRFHLPAVTERQKERLTVRAVERYCPFVPRESIKQIQDLVPNNPRKLKSLIRSLAAIEPQLARHDPDELIWVDIWIAQMLRLESYRFFERLLKGNTLEEEVGIGYRFRQRENRKNEDANAGVKLLMQEVGIDDADLITRLILLVEAARARTSLHFRYMCELAVRPQAVTWKEFRQLSANWERDRRPKVLANWITQHAKDRGVTTDDVEDEVFEAMLGKRSTLLQQAAEAGSVKEQDSFLLQSGGLLRMLEQFLLDLNKLSAPRFRKVYGQFMQWIAFRKNPGDQLQRKREEQVLVNLLASASVELSADILGDILPDGCEFDIGDGSLAMKQALRKKCHEIVAPRAAKEGLSFLTRDGGILSLTEHGRFPAIKYCLFNRRSPVWTTELRDEFLGLIGKGQDDDIIYSNVREYMDLVVRGLQLGGGIDGIGVREISELLKDEEFVQLLWRTATSREIQYRLQMSFLEARQSLISSGASEAAMPLTKELEARVEEVAPKGKEPSAN